MTDLAKEIAIRFKAGESMQDIAQSLGITYAKVQAAVRRVMNEIDKRTLCETLHAGIAPQVF